MVDYAKPRTVFEGYKAVKYSRKYYAEHEADIEVHRAAWATFGRLLGGAKLPKINVLKAERDKLNAEKKGCYREYRAAQRDMRELLTAKANIDHLFGLTVVQKTRKWSDSYMTQQRSGAPRPRAKLARGRKGLGLAPTSMVFCSFAVRRNAKNWRVY